MPAACQLELIVPGLAGPQSDHPVTDYFTARPTALDRLLARSRCVGTGPEDPDEVLLQRFGISAADELPVAELSWLADSGRESATCLLRADPVHLRADQSSLRLFEAHSFDICQQEADALVASINAFAGSRDWRLHAPVPQRWYLQLPAAPQLRTVSPYRVAGRNIDPYLPAGPDARYWRVLMNELQMLLHDHPVNLARVQRGQPAVNSLWFWGNGTPVAQAAGSPAALFADTPVAAGLGQYAALAYAGLPEDALAVADAAGTDSVVLLDSLQWYACYNEVERWLEQLMVLEQRWFRPLLKALHSGTRCSLLINPCNGRVYRTGRWRQRAFWQPPCAYEELLGS